MTAPPDPPDPPDPPAPAPGEGGPPGRAVGAGFPATSGRQVMSASFWNVASSFGPQIWTMVISVAAARFLGPDLLGRQSYIAFFELAIMSLATGAVPVGVMRWIGEFAGRGRLDAVPAVLRWAWRFEGLAAAVGGGAIVLAGAADGRHLTAWTLAAVAGALGVLHTIPSAVLRGLQRWRQASLVGMTTGGMGAAATIAVLAAGGGIAGMFAVEVAVSAVNLLWTAGLARRDTTALADDGGAGFAAVRPAFLRYVAGGSINVIVTLVVFRRSEFFFLERYGTDADIAFYSVAFATVVAVVQVFEGVAGVLKPTFAQLVGAQTLSRVRDGFGRAFRLLATLVLVGSAGLFVLGPRLLEVAYGPEFRPARRAFLVLVAILPFTALVGLSHAVLVGFGRIRVVVVAGLAAAAVNIGLDVLLISRYQATGAAVANNVAQLVAGVPVFVVGWRIVGGVSWRWRSLSVAVAAGVATGLAALAGLRAAEGLGGAAAGLVLGGVPAAVGVVASVRRQPGDAAWLQSVLPPRLAASTARLLVRR